MLFLIKKKLKIYDATCIFVRKNEKQIAEKIQNRNEVIYIGIRNHAETNAALGINSKRVHLMTPKESFCFFDVHSSSPLVVSQTTMTSDDIFSCEKEIKEKIPNAKFMAKQCYATEERQKEVILKGKLLNLKMIRFFVAVWMLLQKYLYKTAY